MEDLKQLQGFDPGTTTLAPHMLGRSWLSPLRQTRVHLPLAPLAVREYCLRFFVSNRLKRNFCRLALLVARWTGMVVLAKRTGLANLAPSMLEALPTIESLATGRPYHLAFMVGTAGPYQKYGALIVPNDASPRTFIKFAVRASADNAIALETQWLGRLAAIPSIRDHVPELQGAGHLSNGRAYLLTSVAPSLEPITNFGEEHISFLSALGKATMNLQLYCTSPEAHFIGSTLDKLADVFGHLIHADLRGGWDAVLQSLASWNGPMVVAHRDFAPWNIRQSVHGVHVFDWEYAALGANPLHDYLHFHLIQIALSKQRQRALVTLPTLATRAAAYARATYADTHWDNAVVTALLLAYLLDVIIFYTDSGQLFDPEHPVLSCYLALVSEREHWLHI